MISKFKDMPGVQSLPVSSSKGLPNIAKKRRKRVGVIGIRVMASLLAFVFLLSSLYYDLTVTNSIRRSMLPLYSVGSMTRGSDYSDLSIYPEPFQELYREREGREPEFQQIDPSSWMPAMRFEMRRRFQRHNRESIYSLLLPDDYGREVDRTREPTVDTLLLWGKSSRFEHVHEHVRKRHKQGLYQTHDLTGRDIDDEEEAKAYRKDPKILWAAWGNVRGVPQKPKVIFEENIFKAFHHAKEIANFSTPHVLITHLNENWGTLSSTVKNRTADWDDLVRSFYDNDCDPTDVKELYLDSPNTLAVFTAQHQAIFDHPKVHSIPIGVANSLDGGQKRIRLLRKHMAMENESNGTRHNDPRSKLLMINNSPSAKRLPQINAIIENFAKEGVKVVNTFNEEGNEKANLQKYYKELSRSKFVVCPSGLGWDSYRIWEALMMGAIPVIERYKFRYEVLTYPVESGKRPRILRGLDEGQKAGDLKAIRKVKHAKKLGDILSDEHIKKYNASIEVVEYYDGWQKTMDDLPIVWIDGKFEDAAPSGDDNSNNYLTPQLLEREYDAMATKMETFQYEKLTSLYWVRFIESFLLLNDPTKAFENGIHGPEIFESMSEMETWRVAMENLSPTFNNHSFLPRTNGRGWAGWKDVEEIAKEGENIGSVENETISEDNASSDYLLGSEQPRVLSWIILIEFKLMGLALVLVAWTKFSSISAPSNDMQSKIQA